MSTFEELYLEFEKLKAEAKEKQLRAKEIKEEIIHMMDEKGVDELVIDGLDTPVKISITYPEREVLNKKGLAEVLKIPQKELSKPQVIIRLTQEGVLTPEMIEQFTIIEERMQFNVKELQDGEDE